MVRRKVEARVTHRFQASPERVFDAWLDPVKARAWMEVENPNLGKPDLRRVEIDPRIGGRFAFSDMRPEGEAVHWGTYLEIDRPRKLAFTWITDPSEETDPSVVTITIEPDSTGCIVTIVHEMDAEWEDWIPQTAKGWGGMLVQMATAFGEA